MNQLLQHINSIHPVSQQLQEHLFNHLTQVTIPKKGYLLKQGRVCSNLYFIEKGLARCFYLKDGKEVSSWFMKEGDMIISVESFFKQQPGYENIQALEELEVLALKYSELQLMYHKFPEFNFIARVLTEKYYTLSEQRLFSLRMQRALERYEYIMEHHPDIIKRVSSSYIASYLGITLETLSRIKHQVSFT